MGPSYRMRRRRAPADQSEVRTPSSKTAECALGSSNSVAFEALGRIERVLAGLQRLLAGIDLVLAPTTASPRTRVFKRSTGSFSLMIASRSDRARLNGIPRPTRPTGERPSEDPGVIPRVRDLAKNQANAQDQTRLRAKTTGRMNCNDDTGR